MQKAYKYLDIITGLFVAVLLISNIASTKITQISILSLDGGTILFPLTYIFNDILTEVYGYNASRRVIWTGFVSALTMSAVFAIVGWLPSAPDWGNQDAYMAILGQAPRIVLASLAAYFVGEFSNSYVLAKMKVVSKGKHLWMRTIGSTLIGELLDSIIFILIAFAGVLPSSLVLSLIISNYLFKTAVEVLLTPITYVVVYHLKCSEAEDYFDIKTNFNPFVLFKRYS